MSREPEDQEEFALPAHSYLATQYYDRRRRLETRRVYYDDGRVEAFDGREWWEVCRLTPVQVSEARAALQSSGLTAAHDTSDAGVYDAARLTYVWRWGGCEGRVTNYAYPARKHPAQEALEARLTALEEQAGAGDVTE